MPEIENPWAQMAIIIIVSGVASVALTSIAKKFLAWFGALRHWEGAPDGSDRDKIWNLGIRFFACLTAIGFGVAAAASLPDAAWSPSMGAILGLIGGGFNTWLVRIMKAQVKTGLEGVSAKLVKSL